MNKAMKEEQTLLELMNMSAMPLDGKKPIVKEWEQKDSKVLFAQIKRGQNFGIRTGKVSNCVVVDIDTKDRGLEIWTALEKKMGPISTYRVTTGSGGLHLYFDYTQGLKNGAKLVKVAGEKVGIDLKTDRGQVVAALSIHPDTLKMYTADVPLREYMKTRKNDEPAFAPLPDWLRSLLVGDTELDKDLNIHAVEKAPERAVIQESDRDEIITVEFVQQLVMQCIKKKRADDYDDWQRIIFGLSNASAQYKLKLNELAHTFSKQSDIYLKKDGAAAVESLWKAKDAKQGGCTLGTVRHFAQLDNPELYKEACLAIAVDGDAPPTEWTDLPLILAKPVTKKSLMKFFRGCLFEVHAATTQFYARMDDGQIVPIPQPFEARGSDRNIPGLDSCKAVFNDLRSKACWLEQNTYKRVDFMPSFTTRIELPRVLNLFTKFPVQPIEGTSPDLEKIMWHIEHILCNENAEFFTMFKHWLGSFLQNPGKKLEIMPMFLGEQGTGKSILFDKLFPILLGDEYYQEIDDMNQLFDRFNGDQSKTLICLLNEIGTHGKDHNQSGKLKSALTRKRKTIETKGMNKYSIPDLTNFLLATNKSCPVKAEVSNRRYAGVTCSSAKIGDKKYFEELEAAINPDSVSRLLHLMLKHDASGWVKSNIPKTEAMQTMTEMSLPAPFRFMIDVASLEAGLVNDGVFKIHSCNLYTAFAEWSRKQGEVPTAERIFLSEVKTLKLRSGPIKIDGDRARGFSTTLEELRMALRTTLRDPTRVFDAPDLEDIQ